MHTHLNSSTKNDERGFAALVVTLILVVILSMLTVGFASLARTNQENTLNNQLNTEAYDAAESGVNDAAAVVNKELATTGSVTPKNSCTTQSGSIGPNSALSNNIIDTTYNIKYSCLLINPNPLTLLYGSNSPDHSIITPIRGITNDAQQSPTTIGSLEVSWQDQKGGTAFAWPGDTSFPPAAFWPSNTGLLQVSLTPLNNLNKSALMNNTFTTFLYPSSGGGTGTVTYTSVANQQGTIISGQCNANHKAPTYPDYCNVKINGLHEVNYLLRIKSFYATDQITVSAFSPGGSRIRIGNAQVSIDSTGDASGVLRRIQVRIPDQNKYDYPEYALEANTGGICKQLQIRPPLPGTNHPSGVINNGC